MSQLVQFFLVSRTSIFVLKPLIINNIDRIGKVIFTKSPGRHLAIGNPPEESRTSRTAPTIYQVKIIAERDY